MANTIFVLTLLTEVFSNIVTNDKLEMLAMSDEHEVVKQVQEYYFDFYAVNSQLFTFGLEHPITEASQ